MYSHSIEKIEKRRHLISIYWLKINLHGNGILHHVPTLHFLKSSKLVGTQDLAGEEAREKRGRADPVMKRGRRRK